MKRFDVEIESRITVKVEADNKEDAIMIAMETSEVGEKLLESANVSDVEECVKLGKETEVKNGMD